MINVSDDTTVENCIKNEDETTYKVEVQIMVGWCVHTNLELNVQKTKEMIIYFEGRTHLDALFR